MPPAGWMHRMPVDVVFPPPHWPRPQFVSNEKEKKTQHFSTSSFIKYIFTISFLDSAELEPEEPLLTAERLENIPCMLDSG